MALSAIYLWQPEIFTGTVPGINDTERAAYDLYQKNRNTTSDGKALKAWIDYIVAKVTAPQYSDFFPEEIQKWATGLQQGLKDNPCAMLEIEHFDILAQGDALYRVFYEAVQASGVGFYEPCFSVWGVGTSQVPAGAVDGVLSSFLKPLSTETQTFDLENIEPPRNIKKAEELMRFWAERHPYAKNLKLHIYKAYHCFINPRLNVEHPELEREKGVRKCLLIDEVDGILYQLSIFISGLTKSPMVSFSMNLTDRFIPKEKQGLLKERLIFTLQSQNIRTHTITKSGVNEIKYS